MWLSGFLTFITSMKLFNLTLRMRIFFSMILIILISFFLTGAFSFYHFKNENEQYHQERLKRKESTIMQSIDFFLGNQPVGRHSDSIVKRFDDKICELASINSMDVNIYSLSGKLLISSNPKLFDTHVLEDQLSDGLLNMLRERSDELLVESHTDTMRYLSTYDFIHNLQNKPIAIVNLPYFDTEDVHRAEIRNFIMRLMWIYILLFLVSIFIAYFLSNYITGSLKAIGEKLQNIKIDETNPPLRWRFDDEVGTLVKEYNRMLGELEKSAAKLARTERESAWKEMAKQVAHEIKNPLTPMRLNVQYLEKSLKTDDPEKLHEFASSMISQIDTLSSIAEAFSRFATMPELKSEHFPAREIIQRVTNLYPEYRITFECENPGVMILGDKDQLVRVMNNLINNSIQAIPEGVEPQITVRMEGREKDVLISLSDNGSGIPEGQSEKIFEPRFTTKTRGMGLGLAMVKKIIDSFNGSIWFNSTPGLGTTFYISLPLAG